MAERLDAWPDDAKAPRRDGRYPWDDWLDGAVWRLAQGRDFDVTIASLRSAARIQARLRGGRVKTAKTHAGGELVIQFIPDGQA